LKGARSVFDPERKSQLDRAQRLDDDEGLSAARPGNELGARVGSNFYQDLGDDGEGLSPLRLLGILDVREFRKEALNDPMCSVI
jgi:hypothetical protein